MCSSADSSARLEYGQNSGQLQPTRVQVGLCKGNAVKHIIGSFPLERFEFENLLFKVIAKVNLY